MCEPGSITALTIAKASLAMAAAGTAISAYSAYSSQKATNKRLGYQAKVAENNALAAKYEGDYAKEQSRIKAKHHRQKVAQAVGKQRAAMGATGIVADEGAFLDLELDTIEQGKLDELAILHEGDKDAWRANIGAANHQAQAGLHRASTSSAGLAAAPELMSGAANVGMNYYNLKVR